MSDSLDSYYKEERPWGVWERFVDNEKVTVKFLHLLPGKRLSLQRHKLRTEFWRVIKGSGTVTIGEEVRPITLGEEALIPVGTLHRLEGGPEGISVLEIMRGEYDENDNERIEDDFGRV
jgi:mannose-6-phosphate isomerase